MEFLLLLLLHNEPVRVELDTCRRVKNRDEMAGLFRVGELCDYALGIPSIRVSLEVSITKTALDTLVREEASNLSTNDKR